MQAKLLRNPVAEEGEERGKAQKEEGVNPDIFKALGHFC